VALASVSTGGGPIAVQAGGAITDGSQGEASTNFSTPDRVSLKAERGIGGTGVAMLRTEATRVEAVNGDLGDVIIGARSGLQAVGDGFRNDAPKGWIALLTESGRIEPGVVQSRSGQWIMLVGRSTIEASDLMMPSVLEPVTASSSGVLGAPVASTVAQETSAVLQVGLEAVKRGLLSQDGQLPLIAVMAATDPLQTAETPIFVREVAPAPTPVSSALQSVSESRPASDTASSLMSRGDRESRRESAQPASAPATSTPSVEQPATAVPSAPADAVPAAVGQPTDAQPSAPAAVPVDPVTPEQPAASSSESEAVPETSEDGPAGEDKPPAEPSDQQSLMLDDATDWRPHEGTRSRWASLYSGWVERIGRWLNGQAPGPREPDPVRVASSASGGDGDLLAAHTKVASDPHAAVEGHGHGAPDRPSGDEPRA
jgi:hypothetical protein